MEEHKIDENSDDVPNLISKNQWNSPRLRWIDQVRGAIMLGLVLTVAIDVEIESGSVLEFFLAHAGREATYMTLYDVGAAAFIFIIGLSMGIAFKKRQKSVGIQKSLVHIGIRFLALFAVGFLIVMADGGLMQERDDLIVIRWDVVISIAATYLLTTPFLFIKKVHLRFLVGLCWASLYQVLLLTTGLRAYAIASNHGGIFGTLFGYIAISVMASAIGEYLYFDSTIEEDKKYQHVLILGIFFLVLGVLIAFIPGMEAAKRQVSLTYVIISCGVTILGMNIFIFFDRKKNLELSYLRAYGVNPFLMYFLAEIPSFLIEQFIGTDLGITPEIIGNLILTVILLGVTSFIAIFTYKKKKIIPTEKIAGLGFVFLVILVIILLLTGNL
ncbi:hypothetical protein [Candidatus Lokiarchaeum ossiferum]|uniref:hypothetical protein n=1 Tax=Candidatus Lokiarchaeum ossiferum TaxID=2951803 RepID=UPI00352FB0B3